MGPDLPLALGEVAGEPAPEFAVDVFLRVLDRVLEALVAVEATAGTDEVPVRVLGEITIYVAGEVVVQRLNLALEIPLDLLAPFSGNLLPAVLLAHPFLRHRDDAEKPAVPPVVIWIAVSGAHSDATVLIRIDREPDEILGQLLIVQFAVLVQQLVDVVLIRL